MCGCVIVLGQPPQFGALVRSERRHHPGVGTDHPKTRSQVILNQSSAINYIHTGTLPRGVPYCTVHYSNCSQCIVTICAAAIAWDCNKVQTAGDGRHVSSLIDETTSMDVWSRLNNSRPGSQTRAQVRRGPRAQPAASDSKQLVLGQSLNRTGSQLRFKHDVNLCA